MYKKFATIFLSVMLCVAIAAPAYARLPVREPYITVPYRIPVTSSNLKSVGFDSNVLEIEFQNGGIYQYLRVPEDIYQDLLSAPSKGRFFNMSIKGRYKAIRIK